MMRRDKKRKHVVDPLGPWWKCRSQAADRTERTMTVVDRRTFVFAVSSMAAYAPQLLAQASNWPSKPIKIVVPYPPGGPTDALARIVGNELQSVLGIGVVVENKPGASGAVGTREVARAEPDGHTLVLGNNQTHATNAVLLKDPGYDPIKDFVPVAGLADLQHVLVVRKGLAVATVADLVALTKASPGKLNYGSTGMGSGSHLTMELFKTRTGSDMTHVPFRGAAPMALEIVADRIDASFATLPSVLGQIQSGDIRALAVASTTRAPQLPDVPTLAERGVTGAEGDSWLALFAPAATGTSVIDKLSALVVAILSKSDVAANATKQGIAVNVRSSEAFRAYHVAEVAKWSDVVQTARIKVDG
jgi:tripartite-type tricarboxylate transporter receptor subunit TctC